MVYHHCPFVFLSHSDVLVIIELMWSIMNEFEFTTERLIIREYKKSDLDDYIAVTSQPQIYETTYGIPQKYTKKYGKRYFRIIRENIRNIYAFEFGMFLKSNGRYLGNVGLINISLAHKHADISYYIDKDFRNMGFTTEAAYEMLHLAFEFMDFEKVTGICMSNNPASRRVMEKLGMKYEGTLRNELLKDGVYYDLDRLSILKEEFFTDSNC